MYIYWDSPTPSPPLPTVSVNPPPPRNQRRGTHRLRVRGRGSPNTDDWRKSLAHCVLCATIEILYIYISSYIHICVWVSFGFLSIWWPRACKHYLRIGRPRSQWHDWKLYRLKLVYVRPQENLKRSPQDIEGKCDPAILEQREQDVSNLLPC